MTGMTGRACRHSSIWTWHCPYSGAGSNWPWAHTGYKEIVKNKCIYDERFAVL